MMNAPMTAVRFEVTNRLDKCLPVEDITKNRFGTKVAL
jgi:hypothetical protein